ncbi:O-antigen ligase family protein [Rhodococcus sp. NPDC060086]|uniref:O-antigen ligase family protein n=1 Tax=Rhodococcus sp. NPDC060086 TaxID=3347055 RepID=UPI003646ABBE
MPLGPRANLAALAITVAALVVAIVRSRGSLESGIVVVSFLITVWWAILLLNPNVISLDAGLTGYRGTVTFVLGIALGFLWLGNTESALRTVWWCLLVACSIAIVVHVSFPEVESSIYRAADYYTSNFRGSSRLQGLFAGPFHAAVAGSFLALSSLRVGSVITNPVLRWIGFAVGILCIQLSEVRTGYVAVLVGAIMIALLAGTPGRRARMIFVLTSLGVCIAAFWGLLLSQIEKIPALASLLTATEDTRFLGREETWQRAAEMVVESPILGWGPGSAGATLAPSFPPGGHVTSHNLVLKFAVEGGILGGVLIVALLALLAVAIWRVGDKSGFALPAFIPLLVFATVGSTVDTLPVSFGIAVILGLCANPKSFASNLPGPRTGRRIEVGGGDR